MTRDGISLALRVGVRLGYDGQVWEVAEFTGSAVLLSGAGGLRQVGVGHLLACTNTRLLVDGGSMDAVEGVGADLHNLVGEAQERLRERVAHVHEVCTGYRRGSAVLALPGEPRPEYGPGVAMLDRYRAKAAELGVGERTVRRWVHDFERDGPAGLVDDRWRRHRAPLGGVDPRWLDTARAVLAEHTDVSTPTRDLVLARIAARLAEHHGAGEVPVPSTTRARALLRELSRGGGTFRGQGQAGDRGPTGHPIRAAARAASGRVPAAGHHPAGCVRHGPGDLALGAGRGDRRVGPV